MGNTLFDYRAETASGRGDHVLHGELTCSAEDIFMAVRYFKEKVDGTDTRILMIEEIG